MDTVVTFKDLLILGVGISAIILLIYLIRLVGTLIKTLKKTNAVLEDAQVITGIASERAKEVDVAVGDVVEVVTNVTGAIKGRQGMIGSVTSIASAFGAIRELLVDLGVLHPKAEPQHSGENQAETETAKTFEDEFTGE